MSNNGKVVCDTCHKPVRVEKGALTQFYFIYCGCDMGDYPVLEDNAAKNLGVSLGTLRMMAKPLNLSNVPCSC